MSVLNRALTLLLRETRRKSPTQIKPELGLISGASCRNQCSWHTNLHSEKNTFDQTCIYWIKNELFRVVLIYLSVGAACFTAWVIFHHHVCSWWTGHFPPLHLISWTLVCAAVFAHIPVLHLSVASSFLSLSLCHVWLTETVLEADTTHCGDCFIVVCVSVCMDQIQVHRL